MWKGHKTHKTTCDIAIQSILRGGPSLVSRHVTSRHTTNYGHLSLRPKYAVDPRLVRFKQTPCCTFKQIKRLHTLNITNFSHFRLRFCAKSFQVLLLPSLKLGLTLQSVYARKQRWYRPAPRSSSQTIGKCWGKSTCLADSPSLGSFQTFLGKTLPRLSRRNNKDFVNTTKTSRQPFTDRMSLTLAFN